jgi:Uncharacterized conserved protein
MKLYMKQKVFSWAEKFTVKDEQEQDRYYVEGEFLTLARKLHVFDTAHNEVAFIRQKLWSFFPRFFVEINGQEICQIVKRFTWFKPKYELEGMGWHVEGDFWAHEYAVFDGSREVMHISQHWLTWGDSYELTIVDPKDELICLSIVLAIDAAVAEASAASTSISSST